MAVLTCPTCGETSDQQWWSASCDKDTEQWSLGDVANHLGVKPRTISSYVSRGQFPQPDGHVGRSPWWFAAKVRAAR